jgi:hypothetical protein
MKKTLLTFIFSFTIISLTYAQTRVTAGQIDDFEDDTVQGWIDGSATTPVNISSDGPAGGADSYLEDYATGFTGSGGRLIIFNESQWTGDFASEGIIAIRFNVRALTNDIDVRVAITGDGGKFSSSTFVTVTAGAGWTTVTIPIGASDLTSVGDGSGSLGAPGFDVNGTLGDVTHFRILSNPVASFIGEFINAEMHLDNIEALTTLSVNETKKVDFSIYPNPSRSKLNISLAQNTNDTKIEVYDILGKRIHAQALTGTNTSINASRWNAGVYLVKITNKTGTQTKRFVKE